MTNNEYENINPADVEHVNADEIIDKAPEPQLYEEPVFTTKEAASKLGINPDLFRYYFTSYEHVLPAAIREQSPYRNRRGNLKVTSEHIDKIEMIMAMSKDGYSKSEIERRLTESIHNENGEVLIHHTKVQEYLNNEAIQKLLENSFKLGVDHATQITTMKYEEELAERDEKLFSLLDNLQKTLLLMQQNSTTSTKQIQDLSSSVHEMENNNKILSKINDDLNQKVINMEETISVFEKENADLKEQNAMHETQRQQDADTISALQDKIKDLESKKGFFSRLFKN